MAVKRLWLHLMTVSVIYGCITEHLKMELLKTVTIFSLLTVYKSVGWFCWSRLVWLILARFVHACAQMKGEQEGSHLGWPHAQVYG